MATVVVFSYDMRAAPPLFGGGPGYSAGNASAARFA